MYSLLFCAMFGSSLWRDAGSFRRVFIGLLGRFSQLVCVDNGVIMKQECY